MFKELTVAAYLVTFIIACALIAGAYLIYSTNSKTLGISSFDECVAAGNPVMEIYPEQCAVNGKVFVNSLDSSSQ